MKKALIVGLGKTVLYETRQGHRCCECSGLAVKVEGNYKKKENRYDNLYRGIRVDGTESHVESVVRLTQCKGKVIKERP